MIRVLFFASLREQLGIGELEVAPDSGSSTVADILLQLSGRGERWAEQLQQDNLLCAVNQVQVERAHPVVSGDELALFPPVTGG